MVKFKPNGTRILVLRDKVEAKTKSGIYLSESMVDLPQTAKIIAIGDKVTLFEIGETIMLGKYGGTSEITLDNVEYIMIEEEKILGKLYE